jgi:hypothetical protein
MKAPYSASENDCKFPFPFFYSLSESITTMEKVRVGTPLHYLVAQISPALVGHLKTSAYVRRCILGLP